MNKKMIYFRTATVMIMLVVCLVFGSFVNNSLADSLWSEPPWAPGVSNVNPPVWNQNASAQTGNLYITGSGRFDASNYGNAYCLPTGSKVCGADNGNVWGVVGESNSGYGLYGSSVSNYGLYASSATSYAGYFAGPVYINGELSVGGKNVCLSDGTNCAASGGYWTASGNNISNSNSGNVGIGSANPLGKLSIGHSFDSASPRANAIYFTDPNNTNLKGYIGMNRNSAAGADKEYLSIEAVEEGVHWMNVILAAEGGNVGIGTTSPGYKMDVSGAIRATGALYANANGAAYLCGGDDACLNDINAANTVGIYGAQDPTQGAIKLGSNGGTISGINGLVKINGKDVCLADGTNCSKIALYATQPTALKWGSECLLTYNNGEGMLVGLPMNITAARTGKIRVTVNGILNSSVGGVTTVKLSKVPQSGYGCTTGAQTSVPVASSKGIYTTNSSDWRAFETFVIYDVTAGNSYNFDLAVFSQSGATVRFSAIEYAIEEL